MCRRDSHLVRAGTMILLWGLVVTASVCMGPVLAQPRTLPTLHWCEEPVEELSPVRGRRVLNGLWRFMPAAGEALKAPVGSWGYIRVPGAWHRTGWAAPQLDGVVAAGSGAPWGGVALDELGRAWYEREILVPEAWAGREILLNVDRLCTDAVVYVDGIQCGRISWPHGKVVLTSFVQPGQKALLGMLVVAAADASKVDGLLSGDEVREAAGGISSSRGLVGDVILESRPKGTRIDGVFVQTSVRRQELKLDVDLVDVGSPGRVTFSATVKDGRGDVARRFEAAADISADAEQTVQLSWKWEDADLWDFLQPNLYTLHLKAEGQGFSDEYAQRFGFREFRVSGKGFLLNEKPFRVRPTVAKIICYGVGMREALDAQMDSIVSAGFNLVEIWPQAEMSRGLAIFWKRRAAAADEMGLPLMYPALNLTGVVGRSGTSEQWSRWERLMVEEWKKVRNHPSIVVLVCTANAYQHNDDQNPRRIGNLEALAMDTSGGRLERLLASGLKAMDVIRRYETTRPVTAHHGSAVGDFHTCDMYLDMIPLQEREEWLSAWAESEDSGPYMAVEFGTPWMASLHRGRGSGSHARTSEPFLTEYCAIYMGDDAYRDETETYRRLIASKFVGGQQYDMWCRTDSPDYKHFPNHVKLQSLFIRNTWRSWRTWGMTGGLLPWDKGYGWTTKRDGRQIRLPPFEPGRLGPYVTEGAISSGPSFRDPPAYYCGLDGLDMTEAGKALVETNSATLAWIAGPDGAFTAKDHHFFPGDTVSKQVVLINDERAEQDYEAAWSAEFGGAEIASGREAGTIGIAQNLFLPLEFTAPEVEEKEEGKITLSARIGAREHTDTFAFRVFPRPAPPAQDRATVLAFDPAGDTTALLGRLGWTTRPWDGSAAGGKVLVIGRNALSGGQAPPGSLEEFVEEGGRLVVFAQDPDWLRERAGFRVARHVARRFYPVPSQAAHPVIAGLDSEDLRDWRGAGTLVPPTANDNLDKDFSDWRGLAAGRRYGWHWGNRGSVSSAALEKPHRSGWRPILEGEFDLAYCPLMELNHGQGLAVWCTLDVEGRDRDDPVADTITTRLLTYVADAQVERRAPRTVYFGAAPGQELLKLLDVRYQEVAMLPRDSTLAIIGPNCRVADTEMAAFLSGGGKAFFMARPAGQLPLGYRAAANGGFHGAWAVPSWPECRGLSRSDLRLRTDANVPVLISGPGQGGADGLMGRYPWRNGVAVLMQLDPRMLDAEEKTYMRLSAWRAARAIAQVLSNMGAAFGADGEGLKSLHPDVSEPPDYYCPGYRTDFELGDDPYRYKRW